jgi:hypothetical protein
MTQPGSAGRVIIVSITRARTHQIDRSIMMRMHAIDAPSHHAIADRCGVRSRAIRVGHNKWICGSESVGHRSHAYIHTYILQDQASPWCTQLQILDLPVLELDPLNIHLLLIFHQPKGRFPPDRQKV